MSDLALLRAMPLFAGLSDAQLQAVAAVLRPRAVPAGTAILREGDTSDALFILARGVVEVTKRFGFALEQRVAPSKEKTLICLTAPQFFGEMGLLERSARSATITARTDCDLLEIGCADFERLAEADPRLGYRVVRNIAVALAQRLRRTDRDVLKLTIALSLALGNT